MHKHDPMEALARLLARHDEYVSLLRTRRLTADEECTLAEIEDQLEVFASED